MTILVTGAAGFIGSHLTEALVRQGEKVRALVHYNSGGHWGWLDTLDADVLEQVEIIPGDITDPFAVGEAVKGCSQVYHLAALIAIPHSYRAPASYVATNVAGTLNVLEACRRQEGVRLIHTSTSEVYGSAQYIPIDELHPLVGQSPYSASKIGADKLAEAYHRSFGLAVTTVRPFNTFGPRQSARAVIPAIMAQALAGNKTISLGALEPVRDLVFVADTAQGFLAAGNCHQAVGKTINLGRGEGISIGDLAAMILKVCQSSATIVTDPARIRPEKSEVDRLISDNSLAKSLLGWTPVHSLEEGLTLTAGWMRENMATYKPESYAT